MAETIEERTVSKLHSRLLEMGGLSIVILLPLYFNPFIARSFEAAKVIFFQTITVGMGATLILRDLYQYRRNRSSAAVTPVWLALRQSHPLHRPITLYAVIYLLATAASTNPSVSLLGGTNRHGTLTVVCTLLFCLLMSAALRTPTQVNRVITALLLGSVPVALYGWVQYFGLDALQWSTTSISPVQSTLGRSIFLGSYLAMVIPFTLSRLVSTGDSPTSAHFRPFPYLLILILQTACLLFTMARGAWLGFVGGCLLFLGLLFYQHRRLRWLLTAIVVLILGSYLFLAINRGTAVPLPNQADNRSTAEFAQIRASSNNSRFTVWQYTLPLIPDRYLLGYGPGTFPAVFSSHYPPQTHPHLKPLTTGDPHNIFLHHLTTVGVLGLFAFLWIIIRFYHITLTTFFTAGEQQTRIVAAAITGSTTAFLVSAQFNPTVVVLDVLFWLCLALGIVIYTGCGRSPTGLPPTKL